MICPYIIKNHTKFTWISYKKGAPEIENGSFVCETYANMECKGKECGAWHKGRCRYNEK